MSTDSRPPISAETASRYFDAAFRGQPVMGVFRNLSPADAVARATTAWDAGVRNIEIPVQVESAIATLEAVVSAGRSRGLSVGAGTVVSVEQIDAIARVGAAYTVAPGLDPVILEASHRRGLPHLPGVATASEITAARRLGLTWLKAFPASLLTPKWISAMHGPFPDVRFVVTGGLDAGLSQLFIDAGAACAAVSAAFSDETQLQQIIDMLAAAEPRG